MISSKNKKKLLDKIEIETIPEEEINKAQQELNVVFHADYRWILHNFGFLDDGENIISGLGGGDQFENVIWLNKKILKKNISKLKPNCIVISYKNTFNKLLILDNRTGQIFSSDLTLDRYEILFASLNDLIDIIYLD